MCKPQSIGLFKLLGLIPTSIFNGFTHSEVAWKMEVKMSVLAGAHRK